MAAPAVLNGVAFLDDFTHSEAQSVMAVNGDDDGDVVVAVVPEADVTRVTGDDAVAVADSILAVVASMEPDAGRQQGASLARVTSWRVVWATDLATRASDERPPKRLHGRSRDLERGER